MNCQEVLSEIVPNLQYALFNATFPTCNPIDSATLSNAPVFPLIDRTDPNGILTASTTQRVVLTDGGVNLDDEVFVPR